jgi:hypothetical protein
MLEGYQLKASVLQRGCTNPLSFQICNLVIPFCPINDSGARFVLPTTSRSAYSNIMRGDSLG